MGEFDRVDRLMQQAKQAPVRKAAEPDAEAVLEERVSASERGVPRTVVSGTGEPETEAASGGSKAGRPSALAAPHVSPAERGRQILGALKPFLPVVGGALRMVDHSAAQAVARMLPALGVMGAARTPDGSALDAKATAIIEKQHAELKGEIRACQAEIAAHDEKLRKMRESLERAVAEQGTSTHRVNQLEGRLRLLTAGVVILLMLVAAEAFLLLLMYRR